MNAIVDLDYSIPLPPIWDLLSTFSDQPHSKTWNYYNNGTVIEADDVYHRFIWTRGFHLHTFKNLIQNPFCTICIHNTFKFTHPAYTAWILAEPPLEDLWLYLIHDAPEQLSHVAIYDLSRVYSEHGHICLTINETQSEIFNAFEQYLTTKYNISCHQLTGSSKLT
jgi:hypothetical protein